MAANSTQGGIPSKQERLAEFFRRFSGLRLASSFEEAYQTMCATLDQVEDELSGLPNEPENWMNLDRLFPPQKDRMSTVQGTDVKRLDSLRHVTYIAPNGAIEIRTRRLVNGEVVVHLSKEGSDGRSVCDICPELRNQNL